MIKTGILTIPSYDEEAVAALRRCLAAAVPSARVLQELRASMQRHLVEETLRRWADEEELDLILTVGGTLPAPGPGNQECVPEATLAVAERLMPGLSETMRRVAATTLPLAPLDRGVAVIRGRTLILNLPAGASAAVCFLTPIASLLVPIVAHLQETPAAPGVDTGALAPPTPPAVAPATGKGKKELDPAEFADYLKRRSPGAQ